MTEVNLFPRLGINAAQGLLSQIRGRSINELCAGVNPEIIEATYSATGGSRVDIGLLRKLRDSLIDVARGFGFPEASGRDIIRFEPSAAEMLLKDLHIVPGEAARDEVWSFICIALLPDLTTWRFPDQHETRFIGGVRNAFQRLWWRAYLLRDSSASDPMGLLRLPEDALVGLMERPGISSNPAVARSIARAVSRVAESLSTADREDGWRLAYKRIRQRIPLVNFDVLPETELVEQLERICGQVVLEFQQGA